MSRAADPRRADPRGAAPRRGPPVSAEARRASMARFERIYARWSAIACMSLIGILAVLVETSAR